MALQGIDVEAAVGRKKDVKEVEKHEEKEIETPSTPKREAEEELGPNAKRAKEGVVEEDAEVEDANGKTEEAKKPGDEEAKAEDTAKTTTV